MKKVEFLGAATLFSLFFARHAAAQRADAENGVPSEARGTVVVIPAVEITARGAADAVIAPLEETLQDAGYTVVSPDADALPAALPPPPTPDRIRALEASSRTALEHVAFGRNAQVGEVVLPILDGLGADIAALGRRDETRRAIGDMCLYLVRAHRQEHRNADADRVLSRCFSLVPDLIADSAVHSAETRQLVDAARQGLTQGHTALDVVIEGPRARTCAARLQGRPIGTGPEIHVAVFPGTAYVDVQCAGADPSHVYAIEIAADATASLRIPLSLDRAIDVEDRLRLTYLTRDDRQADHAAHAGALASMLGADAAVVPIRTADRWLLTYVRAGAVDPSPVTSMRAFDPTDLSTALAAMDPSTDTSDTEDSPPPRPPAGSDPAGLIVGVSLGVVGLAGAASAWGIYFGSWTPRNNAAASNTRDVALAGLRSDASNLTLALAAPSFLLLSLSMPMILPAEDGVPVWSWILGGVGVGTVAAGIIVLQQPLPRPAGAMGGYYADQQSIPLGPLVAMHGAPLLAIPLTHLIRSATGSNVLVQATADSERAFASFSGEF